MARAEQEKDNARQWAEVAAEKLESMLGMMSKVQARAKEMDGTLEMYEEVRARSQPLWVFCGEPPSDPQGVLAFVFVSQDISAYHDALVSYAQDDVDNQAAARDAKAAAVRSHLGH